MRVAGFVGIGECLCTWDELGEKSPSLSFNISRSHLFRRRGCVQLLGALCALWCLWGYKGE
jgi:hypothetical protein